MLRSPQSEADRSNQEAGNRKEEIYANPSNAQDRKTRIEGRSIVDPDPGTHCYASHAVNLWNSAHHRSMVRARSLLFAA